MSSEGGVDLDDYLCILDRSQLEHLVVRMIMKDDSNFDALVEATHFLDEELLLENIEAFPSNDTIEDSTKLFAALAPIVVRATKFSQVGQGANAVKVLYAITNDLVIRLVEAADLDNFPREELNECIASIENAWKVIIAKYIPAPKPTEEEKPAAKKVDKKKVMKSRDLEDDDEDEEYEGELIEAPVTYEDLFKTLADWRVKLTEKLGPLFSDPLRVLKATMMKNGKTKPTEEVGGIKKKAKK